MKGEETVIHTPLILRTSLTTEPGIECNPGGTRRADRRPSAERNSEAPPAARRRSTRHATVVSSAWSSGPSNSLHLANDM